MDREAKFWNKLADRYSRRPIADEAAYERKLEITRQYFQPDMDVLELGCGTGHLTMELVRRYHADGGVFEVSVSQHPADRFNYASLDVVMAHNVLHLLDDREEAIAEVHQMLKPGGVFVSSTACVGDMMLPLRLIVPVGRFLRLFPLVRVFSVARLKDSFEKAGFEIDYEWQPKKNAAVFIVCRKR